MPAPISFRAIRPKRFKIINPAVTRQGARDGIREYLEKVKKIMQDNYDTTKQPKVYERTYRLQKGWKVKVRSNNFGDLINDAEDIRRPGRNYAALVQGPRSGGVGESQLPSMRRRGWKSITDVTHDTAKDFEEIMNRKIRGGVF